MALGSRRCPKCGGILMIGSYLGEWYENCVQCGNLVFLERYTPPAAGRPLPAEGKWEAVLEEAQVGSPRKSVSSVRGKRRRNSAG